MSAAAEIVGAYLRHVADHSIEEALACLAPEFELEFKGAGFALRKDQVAKALEWDVGANGTLDWNPVEEAAHAVTIRGTEGNDFLDLIGVGRLTFSSIFMMATTGLISRQLHDVSWGEVSLSEAMRPLIDWASEHEPKELADIFPRRQMSYSRAMAVRWVRLAKKWKAGTSS